MPSFWRQQPQVPVPRQPVGPPNTGQIPTVPVRPATGTGSPWSGGAVGGYAPTPAAPAYAPPVPSGGGGGGGGGGGTAPTPTGAPQGDLGPFQTVDQWAAQFELEHGRPPSLEMRRTAAGNMSNDWLDFQDSVNFYRQTGRGPTLKEWKNRYYTGYWWPDNRGYGGGGGGGGGYQQSLGSGTQYPADMGIYWWNTR